MNLPRGLAPGLAALALIAFPVVAQEPIDTVANRKIREEGFSHSRVLETALQLSDLAPPRLAGSPGYLAAGGWATRQLKEWGVTAAGLEPWGHNSPSWVLDRFSVELTAPWYLHLTAFPRAWSRATPKPVSGGVALVSIQSDSDFARYRGALRGKVVLNGAWAAAVERDGPMVRRFTDAELDSMERLADPGRPASPAADMQPWKDLIIWGRAFSRFLREEGAIALLEPSELDDALRVDGWFAYPGTPWPGVPSFVVTRAHFNRLVRLVQAGRTVRMTVNLQSRLVRGDSLGYNVVAEIPGSDPALKRQVVMLGGHLDSWISGTGAADNAAGCAVGMEVLRILTAQGLQPRRTVRLVLWDAEEPSEDYSGSAGYVRRHFGPEAPDFSVYFNYDMGSGRIRGINLQGDRAARPIFESLLAPFADLGANHVSIANIGETDHVSFWARGLPAFQFIQDPLDYDSRVHHSDLDTGDYLREADLAQAAVVLASLVYHAAVRDELIPRGQP
jgi:hypothetical protein